ncbi:MAG: DUF58 domain-containing protein [Thermoanaerobaculia bacterium]|jgi:uncharacterized protein (DUF58 family)
MDFSKVPLKAKQEATAPGVYVELDELIRLQFKARGFSFLPRQPIHSLLAGRHASRIRGRGLDFEELRGYLPGDDPRSIDWKVTARAGKPYVRVFTEERDRPALLVVDQRINMFFGTQVAMKSVVAAQLAALGAWRVFDQGDRVGGLVFDDQDIVEVRPHRSRVRVMQILQAVVDKNRALRADIEVEPNGAMLNKVLERVVRTAHHDYLVTVISDFHGADDETRRLLTRLAEHNDVLAAHLYDPSKVKPLEGGHLVLTDGQLQVEIDTSKGKLTRDLADYFSADLQETKDILAKVGIPVLLIDTVGDPVEQIRAILGQARGRQAATVGR